VRDDAPLVWKEEFRAAIASVAAEFGLLVVDPTPALLAAGPGSELFMDAVHPTPAGHAVIARVLAEALEPLLRARSAAAQSER
jgi:lysophospholipase L1-like esterase